MTAAVVSAVVAVLVVGGVAFVALTGDDEGRREIETGGVSDIAIRERATTSTSVPARETTTSSAPTTTTAPPLGGPVVPFPDFGDLPQPGTPDSPGLPGPGITCPGGGLSTEVSSTSSSDLGSQVTITVEGVVVNNTTGSVTPELTVNITHDGTGQPSPWVQPVRLPRPTLQPGESVTWSFTGTVTGGDPSLAGVSAIGGGFRWADPALASCPTH